MKAVMKTHQKKLIALLGVALVGVTFVSLSAGCKKPDTGGAPAASGSAPAASGAPAAEPPQPGAANDPIDPVSPNDEHDNATKDISKHNAKAELDALEKDLK